MGCGIDLLCYVSTGAADAVNGAIGGIENQLTDWLTNLAVGAETWAVKSALSFYLNLPAPGAACVTTTGQVATTTCSGGLSLSSGPISFMYAHTIWFAGFAGVLGFLIAGGRLAIERRASAAKFAVRGILNIVFTFFISTAVIEAGISAGTAYSQWIIKAAMNSASLAAQEKTLDNLGATINHALGADALIAAGAVGSPSLALSGTLVPPLLAIGIAVLCFLSGVAQVFLMLARNATLVLLAALLPISACASTTETGQAWFRKHLNWVFAFLLYAPVASTILAFAYLNLAAPGVWNQLSGAILFMMSVISLPALMRLMVPMVSQVTTQSSGGGVGAAVGVGAGVAGIGIQAATGLPTGAVAATGSVLAGASGAGRGQFGQGGNG